MNILQAIRDEHLIRPFLGGDLGTWQQWFTALRCLYGLPVRGSRARRLVETCTGKSVGELSRDGFDTALFLTGRRSGKSRMAAVIGAYEAALAGHEEKLSKGETGVVAIISPSKTQSRVVKQYTRSIFDGTPMLQQQLSPRQTRENFELRNNVRIEILAGDWRTIRGFTLIAAIVDEACFFGLDAESKVRSDTELIRAIQPSLATVGGKLIAISSPYAKRGWAYESFKRHWGAATSDLLVWRAPSRTMNPTLPQSVVDRAMAEDMAAAKAEYLAEWRDDVGAYLPRQVIEQSVVKGRRELLPEARSYVAFADLSGGRQDDAALAVAHREEDSVVIDFARRWRPPFSPDSVVADMCEQLRRYSVRHVVGDNYAAEWVSQTFTRYGVHYTKADRNKSALYLELLPLLSSQQIQLLDDDTLVSQLANLERRTRSGGKDVIDHSPGHHDDLANAVAGAAVCASKPVRVLGALCSPVESGARERLFTFLNEQNAVRVL